MQSIEYNQEIPYYILAELQNYGKQIRLNKVPAHTGIKKKK